MPKQDPNAPPQQKKRDDMDDERMRGRDDVRGIAPDESDEDVDDGKESEEEDEGDEGTF